MKTQTQSHQWSYKLKTRFTRFGPPESLGKNGKRYLALPRVWKSGYEILTSRAAQSVVPLSLIDWDVFQLFSGIVDVIFRSTPREGNHISGFVPRGSG